MIRSFCIVRVCDFQRSADKVRPIIRHAYFKYFNRISVDEPFYAAAVSKVVMMGNFLLYFKEIDVLSHIFTFFSSLVY